MNLISSSNKIVYQFLKISQPIFDDYLLNNHEELNKKFGSDFIRSYCNSQSLISAIYDKDYEYTENVLVFLSKLQNTSLNRDIENAFNSFIHTFCYTMQNMVNIGSEIRELLGDAHLDIDVLIELITHEQRERRKKIVKILEKLICEYTMTLEKVEN